MISKPLLKREIKANYKILIFIMAVMVMYESIIGAMFDPNLGKSLKIMAESMKPIFAAIGMNNFSPILVEFMADMLYGLILLIFPLIIVMLLAHRLMTRYVDKGSMAYLLATPNSRKKIVCTQALIMLLSIFCLVLFAFISCIIVCQIMFPGKLEINKFVYLNLGLLCLMIFLSGICFCSSCVFSEAKFSDGIGIGLCVAFILFKMISQMGDKAEFLQYVNPITLYDTKALVAVETAGLIKSGVLLIGGVVLYVLSIKIFCKRDLSL